MTEDQLQRDIDLLASLLDEVILEQAGERRLALLDDVRRLARERRAGLPGAEERMAERIRRMDLDEMQVVVRSLSLYFDLANLAEDLQRVRVIRRREREAWPRPRRESIAEAVQILKNAGRSAHDVRRLVERLGIDLVFTAHPTEAKRRTSRRLIRALRSGLKVLNDRRLLPAEREQTLRRMRAHLTILWQIDLMRPQRPTVFQEIERGLFFVEGLWQVVPVIFRELRQALATAFPSDPIAPAGSRLPLERWLRFGSWMGGDRDGNPNVTADVTAESLMTLRRTALERHREFCRNLLPAMGMSERQVAVAPSVKQFVAEAAERWPGVRERLAPIPGEEVYRRALKVIEYRLERAMAAPPLELPGDGGYGAAAELEADVGRLAASLRTNGGEAIAACLLDEWCDLVRTFGLHLAALDVRQESRVHAEVLTELFAALGHTEQYADLPEPDKQSLLAETMGTVQPLPEESLSDAARDTLALFRLLVRTVRAYGLAPLGGYVISMTHHPSDVLAVQWFWSRAWSKSEEAAPGAPRNGAGAGDAPDGAPADEPHPAEATVPVLPIVPLFETMHDLKHVRQILDPLLANPAYADYLRRGDPPAQTVMVGYSDSTKDGGYLAAGWGLHQAQEQLVEAAERHGVRLVVFHGRGGALGRGGGPAARAIRSLPPRAVGGVLRMTEQGEVLAERYDDPQIAHRHLEQVASATLLVSGLERNAADPRWVAAIEALADRSYRHYRRLVEDSGFLAYFDQATPIGEIEHLPIGSRPARRRAQRTLASLRAIPWTFAWMQCRHVIPAWFGLGTAVHALVHSGGDWSLLHEMYEHWALFRALIDNADLALSKADLPIAHRYAQLALDREAGERIWRMIDDEYRASRAAVLLIAGEAELLGRTPWLKRSIQSRNPYVDPLNLIQIELIRRLRALGDAEAAEIDPLRELARTTIQGIAAGMRTTG